MNELQLMNIENTDITRWDFEAIKQDLQQRLDTYGNRVYTDKKIAKDDKSTVNKVKKAIEDARKAYKAQCMAPYEAVEGQVKELVALLDSQLAQIEASVKDFEAKEKEAKEQEIKSYYQKKSFVLGTMAEGLYEKIFNVKWLNASCKKAQYEMEMQECINSCHDDIQRIIDLKSEFQQSLLDEYRKTLSMDVVLEKQKELTSAVEQAGLTNTGVVKGQVSPLQPKKGIDHSLKEATFKVHASEKQMKQLRDFMKIIGVTYEQL